MATILLLSGPNLNLLGEREPEHYGTTTLDELVAIARETAAKLGHDLEHVQSNHEGALIDAIHGARGRCGAIVVNAGAFSHYAFAITDALAMFDGAEDRGASVEPVRARALAPSVRALAGGRRRDRRAEGNRLPPRGRGRRNTDGGAQHERSHDTARTARGRAAPRAAARAVRRGRHRRAARHQARERPLPHRVHRLGRDVARH